MADFWGNLGADITKGWNDITGQTQKDQAAKQNAAGAATAATGAQTAATGNAGVAAGQGTMGTAATNAGNLAGVSGTQSAEEAGKAGAALGEQMGQQNAVGAAQNVARSARTSGLNAGQAAQLGGQATGEAFTKGQQAGQGMGMQAYGQGADRQLGAVNTQGTIGANQAGAGVGQINAGTGQINAGTGQQGVGVQQQAAGQQQGKDFWGGVTGLATSALGLSDKNAKTDIKDSSTVDNAAAKIKEKSFRYKQGDGGKEVGVIAQDLEKVAPGNVVETPAGKAVDTRKQTLTNTAWITDLARRIKTIEQKGA